GASPTGFCDKEVRGEAPRTARELRAGVALRALPRSTRAIRKRTVRDSLAGIANRYCAAAFVPTFSGLIRSILFRVTSSLMESFTNGQRFGTPHNRSELDSFSVKRNVSAFSQ